MMNSSHRNAEKYLLTRLADIPISAVEQRPVEGGVEFSVMCGRCHGSFTVLQFDRVHLSGFVARTRTSGLEPVPVVCECGMGHENHPPDETGCGAVWEIVP
jgi:hypothetical protein